MGSLSLLDPVGTLAYHFRSFGAEPAAKKTPLRIPSPLQSQLNKRLGASGLDKISNAPYSPKTITNLVSSISDEDFERWCLLDATAFIFITKILLEAEPCLAKDQGFFRLIEVLETLRDQSSELSMPERLLILYKNTVGEPLAVKLLETFLDCEESGFTRRWTGMLLVELLEESEANKGRVWKLPDKSFKDIGEVIVSGGDRMLKIVAGKMICQLMQTIENEEEIRQRLSTFYQSDQAGDFTKGFPLEDNSQWENEFASFVDEMELNRYELDLGPPNGYTAVQVILGNNSPISADIGAISINIAEIFSIYIPPNADRSPDWLDLKIVNISKIEFTKQITTGDSMNDLMYLKLHLYDCDKDGYLYLLSMRPSSDSDNITMLCYKSEIEYLAEDIEKCQESVLLRKGRRQLSGAPLNDIQANPEYRQSQQQKIDELERHREDILKVLESPTAKYESDEYASSLTDPDEFEDGWDMSLPAYKPVEPIESEDNTKERVKETPEKNPMVAGTSEHAIISNLAKRPPELMNGRNKPISYPKHPVGTSDIVLESSFPVPIAPNINPEYIPSLTAGSSLPALRTPTQAPKLQKVTNPNVSPITIAQPPIAMKSNYQKGLEEVFNILKGKTPSVLRDDQRHYRAALAEDQAGAELSMKTPALKGMPTPHKNQEDIHNPKPTNSVEHLKGEDSGKPSTERLDADGLQEEPEGNTLFLISGEKWPPRNIKVKGNGVPITVKNKPKVAAQSAVLSIPEDPMKFRTTPDTYGTKNRAKREPKPKEKGLRKGDPPYKGKSQTVNIKPTKTRASVMKLDKEKLSASDDAIWELPVSEGSEIEAKNPKKKGTGRLKVLSPKKPAAKPKQLTKSKPPPQKRVYGKKSISKPEPKSKEIISNSDKEIEVEPLVVPPVRRQKQSPGSKDKVFPEAVPDSNIFSENEPGDKVVAHSLRPKVKPRPKPKSRSPPASGLANRTLPKRNEKLMESSGEEELIRPSTPPTPTPKPRKKELAKLVLAKCTAPEGSDDEHARLSPRETGTKITPKSVSILRLDQLQQREPLIISTKEKKPAKMVPTSVLTKRVASPDVDGDGNKDTGPQGKRKKPDQPKIGQTAERAHQQPLYKKTLESSKKCFKSDAHLSTSDADEDSSWRPKTRPQVELKLANKSAKTRSIIQEPHIMEVDSDAEYTHGIKSVGQSANKGRRRSARRRTAPNPESSEDEIEEFPQRISGTAVNMTSGIDYQFLDDEGDPTLKERASSECEPKGKTSISRVISGDGPRNLNESGIDKRGLFSIKSANNQAPIAGMSLAVPGTRFPPQRSKNHPENHFQGSALLQKQNKQTPSTLTTPVNMTKDPKAQETRLGVLVDDRLARKAQIISWGSSGPKNQGRAPIIEKIDSSGDNGGDSPSSNRGGSGGEGTSFSTPERGFSLMIIASDDEDRIIMQKKLRPSPPIRLDRRDMENVICMNERPPPPVPISRVSGPLEPLGNNNSDSESLQPNPIDSQGDSDAVSDLEAGDINDNNLKFSAAEDADAQGKDNPENGGLDGVLTGDEPITSEEKDSHFIKKRFTVIELSSDSEVDDRARPQPSERSRRRPGNTFGARKSPDSYINEKSGKEWSVDAVRPSPKNPIARNKHLRHSREDPDDMTLNKRGLVPIEYISSTPTVAPTMASDTVSETKMVTNPRALEMSIGSKNQETDFSKWLQESGFRNIANDSNDNRKARDVPKNSSRSSDPDKTLVNENSHDESEMSQERKKKQGNNHRKRMLRNESDDSDSDTTDCEDSDTDDEDSGEESEESSEDEDLRWRRSVPDYHRESLSVLNQISRGLLRYLMSSEELAIEIINDFEKQGKAIAGRLSSSHKGEYKEFLARVRLAKEKVQAEHVKIMEAVEEDLTKTRKRSETLAGVRKKLGKEYETLGDTIIRMITSLEEDLGRSML